MPQEEPDLEVLIGNMSPADLDEILPIEFASFPTPWSRSLFMKEFQHTLGRHLVAKTKRSGCDEIAGYISYWVIADEVHLQHIATREDLRRSGVASRLCAEMMLRALTEGARRITLEVRRSNVSAIKLYEKFGFIVKGIRPGYYDDTHEDALIMWADVEESLQIIDDES